MSEFRDYHNLLVGCVIRPQLKQSNRSVLVGFSNGIRGAKWRVAINALGDLDNHISGHGRNIRVSPSRRESA